MTARQELANLVSLLSERALAVVDSVARGSERQCNDETLAFALQYVCGIQPMWMYDRDDDDGGGGDRKHLFIHSQCVATELKRHAEFVAALRNCDNRFERNGARFEFSANQELASFVALKRALGSRSLDIESRLDTLYLPIYHENHCSLLLYSVPRRLAIHLDSLSSDAHQLRARAILGMLVDAGLLRPYLFQLRAPASTPFQRGSWECAWCALLFARWWRHLVRANTAVEQCRTVRVDHAAVRVLAGEIGDKHRERESLAAYAQRLELGFGAVLRAPPKKAK